MKTHTFLLKKEGTLKQPTKGENTRRREENKEDEEKTKKLERKEIRKKKEKKNSYKTNTDADPLSRTLSTKLAEEQFVAKVL